MIADEIKVDLSPKHSFGWAIEAMKTADGGRQGGPVARGADRHAGRRLAGG
jgi:hypothetical protein